MREPCFHAGRLSELPGWPEMAEHPVGFRGRQVLLSGRNPEQSTRIQLIRPSRFV